LTWSVRRCFSVDGDGTRDVDGVALVHVALGWDAKVLRGID
jgi:hypothetical protein